MALFDELAEITRKQAGGDKVWCRACGREAAADHKKCLKYGWPLCCGATMTIDPPDAPTPPPEVPRG